MSVQVSSSLFMLKKAACLLQEQQLGGHLVPTLPWWDGLGAVGAVRFQEGTLAKAWSARLYSKVGFILDVGKCSQVFVVGGKGNCGVRPMWVIR